MAIIQGTSKSSAATYEIDQSIRFNDDDAAYLYRDVASAPTDGKKFTYSVWIKRGAISATSCGLLSGGSGTSTGRCDLVFTAGASTGDGSNYDALKFDIYSGGFDQTRSLAKLRDPSSWYHIVFVFDAANATANDTMIMYLNGDRLELDSTSGVPNVAALVNANGQRTRIGADASNTPVEFDGYMAEINMIDGQALAPTEFGETNSDTGQWVPIEYTGSYGTNGFYLKGQDSSALGDDSSGNGNDFTSTGLAAADQMPDTPTNNFCTLNPVEPNWGGAVTLSDGNLAIAGTAATVWNNAVATFKTLPSTGKWIWAAEPNTSGGGQCDPWIVNETGLASRNNYVYVDANGWETTFDSSSVHTVLNNGASRNASFTYGSGDFHVICFDADSKKLWFGVYDVSAGTLQFHDGSTGLTGDPGAGTNQTYTLTGNEFSIGFGTYTGRGGNVDFGQSDLLSQITIPTGFLTLCTANLDDPTIADPSAYFQTTLYSGNSSTQEINQSGNSTFEPGWVWIKPRDGAGYSHQLFDQVRGATKRINSDAASSETTTSDTLTSFDSDGFSLGSHVSVNQTGKNMVAWQWAADGTSGSSNTDGSITSTVSANTTSGFSIVSYTGTGANATVGHGLGVAPSMVICKQRNASRSWVVYHEGLTSAANVIYLNQTVAQATDATVWNSTDPTSTVFSVGSANGSNSSGNGMIAYCFAEVEGFSKFTSYESNSNSDGPFIYCGFLPSFVLIKNADAAEDWWIQDAAREPHNGGNMARIAPNSSAVEADNVAWFDFVSNGLKVRYNAGGINSSGTHIVMAFAETPFKTATAR